MKTNILIAITTCILSLSLFAENVVLKIAIITPEGSLFTKKLREMNKEIKKKTKGRVKFKIYAAAKKGTEKKVAQKIQTHKLDGALFLQSGMDELVPKVNLLKLPYFYKNHSKWEKAQKSNKKNLEKAFLQKNIKVFGWTDMGFTYIFSNKRLESLSQLRKMKSWIYEQEPLMNKCLQGLQLNGKKLDLKNVRSSLQNKTIDNVYASPYLLVAMQWHQHVKYAVDLPISNLVGGFVLTTHAYDSIPQKYRKNVRKIIKKYMKVLKKTIQKENKIAKKLLLKKYDIKFVTPDQNWINTCKNLGKKIATEQVGTMYSQTEFENIKNAIK